MKENPLFILILLEWIKASIGTIRSLKRSLLPLSVFFGIGLGLILLRGVLLQSVPYFLKHVKGLTIAIDVFMVIFVTLENIVDLIIEAIQNLIRFFKRSKPKLEWTVHKYANISSTDAQEILLDISHLCPPMNNMPTIMSFILKDTFNPLVCPVVRAVQPTLLAPVAQNSLGWLAYNTNPNISQSCTSPPETSMKWVCTGFGSGFLILELVLPIFIFVVVAPSLIPALYHTLRLLVNAASKIGERIYQAGRRRYSLTERAQ